ncbi:predicted protein [Chaetoceros tenuissimus]|uniref:Uncharacterized protein n=1 Tax=Chaetoceros tenuissimus TaxID=426638 RepID=A0AAD3DEU0_9STRA|nr:predicted protein [Chaetoceros tenuissimus]
MGNSNSSSVKNEEERIRVKQEECHDGTDDASDLQISIDLEMIYKFYSLGFVKVEEDADDGETQSSRIIHWPVLQVDPFDAPEKIYKKWLKECKNSTSECKLYLLYQYGVDEFIVRSPSLIVSYEEGIKRGFDLIPDHIFTKLKRGKPLLTVEVCLIQSLQKLQIEARKEKLDRKNLCWKGSKKHGTWVAKRKRDKNDELKRSNKRRNTNAVPSVISVPESKVNTNSQMSPGLYQAPATSSFNKKRSKKLDDVESFMQEDKDIAERVKERRQTSNQKYEKAFEAESSKRKRNKLDNLESFMEEDKDIAEKEKERRQIRNHNEDKVEAETSKKESKKFDCRGFNEEEKGSVVRVTDRSQKFNDEDEKASIESFSAEESVSDEDLPELVNIVKTQQSSHQAQVKTEIENGDSKIHVNERDESILSKNDSTRRNKSDMKEHSSSHPHENRLPNACIMRPTQELNPQSFPQQDQKQEPIVTEEKGGAISVEFGSGYCDEEEDKSMSNSEIEHNAEQTIPKEFRDINIFEVHNERTICFKHWCLSRMSKSIKAKFHEVMFARYEGKLYPISVLSPFDLFPCDYQSAYLREYLFDDGYALIYYYGSARNLGISPESDLVEFKDGVSEFNQALNEIKECKKNGLRYSKSDLKIMTLGFEKAKEDLKRPTDERLKEFLTYEQAKFKFLQKVDKDVVNDYRKIGTIQHRGKQVPVLQICPLEIDGGSVVEKFTDMIMHKKHNTQRRCVFIYGDKTKHVYKFVDATHIQPMEDGQSPSAQILDKINSKRGLTIEERETYARWKHMKLDMQVYRFQRPASLALPEDL